MAVKYTIALVAALFADSCDDAVECFSSVTLVAGEPDIVLRRGDTAVWQARPTFEPGGGWSYEASLKGTVLAAGDPGTSNATFTVRLVDGAELASFRVSVERNAPRIEFDEDIRITDAVRDACSSSCMLDVEVEISAEGEGVISVDEFYASIVTHGESDEEIDLCGIDSGVGGTGPDPLWATVTGDTDTDVGDTDTDTDGSGSTSGTGGTTGS